MAARLLQLIYFYNHRKVQGGFPVTSLCHEKNFLRIFLKYTLEPHCSRNIFTNQPRVAGRMDEDAKVDCRPRSKIAPTVGPTFHGPLNLRKTIALATYLGVRWDKVPFNFCWNTQIYPQDTPCRCFKVEVIWLQQLFP